MFLAGFIWAQSGEETQLTAVLDDTGPAPVERICRHPSGDQRFALVQPGTAWLQLDTGPRARLLRLSLDPLETETILETLLRQSTTVSERGEDATRSSAPSGIGGESCELKLDSHGQELLIRYGNLDTLSPGLATMDRLVDDLVQRVLNAPVADWSASELPIGAFLRRRSDGVLFEFYGTTGDGRGAELHGVSQPLIVIDALDDLPRQYQKVSSK